MKRLVRLPCSPSAMPSRSGAALRALRAGTSGPIAGARYLRASRLANWRQGRANSCSLRNERRELVVMAMLAHDRRGPRWSVAAQRRGSG